MFTADMFKGINFKAPKNVPKKMIDSFNHGVEENKEAWISAMGRLGIEKTVFMSVLTPNDIFRSFINSSSRFVGFARINPTAKNAIDILKDEISNGMKGVKLYASSGEFNVGSRQADPFYKYCEKNDIPITIHFGVTIGGSADIYTGNPIHLSRVLSDFPGIKFAIAHFGAGYFREALMLKYKMENLFIETSGTNNWLAHQDNFMTLKDVFKKSIDVFGVDHIIFGTDTRIYPDGYRDGILKQQLGILKELDLGKNEIEQIMYKNAKNFIGL